MGVRLRFEILGPLRCFAADREIPVPTPRERTLLAILLLRAGEPVPAATLVDAVWGESLPRNARGQLQSSIWRLRSRLAVAGGSRDLVATDPIGYRIRVSPEDLDLLAFRHLRGEARSAAAAGDPARANDHYRAALAQWRGPALSGIESSAIRDHAAALDEEYVQVLEDCIAIELDRGKGNDLVPELTGFTRQYPYREKLHAALMLALYREGRQADALAAYQRARQLLQDEVGIEPGDDLQKLHKAVLNRDPTLDLPRRTESSGAAATFVPAQPRMLPADIPDFVGRTSEIDYIRTLLTHPAGTAVPVVAIAGSAGVGKTALSVHIAHLLRSAYPDGQLFADLHGFDQHWPAVEPYAVLGRFLRALGMDGNQLPASLDERADLYRNLLAGRRAIVVLDNASSDRQIADLLPGDPVCGVLVNSRLRLGGLSGATLIDLDVLEHDAACALVTSVVGAGRIAEDPDVASFSELIQLCGHLPLAIRIAAGKLVTKPHWQVATLVTQLRDERTRLDRFSQGPLDLRASISFSYRDTPADAQRLLRRLGDLDLPDATAYLAAALIDTSVEHAGYVLEQLHDAQLVEVARYESLAGTRYRLHDFVRLYAQERATQEESESRLAEARGRALGSLLTVAEAAHRRFFHGHETHCLATRHPVDDHVLESLSADPVRWIEEERPVVVAAVRRAAHGPDRRICWALASAVTMLFQLRGYYDDVIAVIDVARDAADQAGDALGIAASLFRAGTIGMDLQDYEGARSRLEQAIYHYDLARSRHGVALATAYLATVDRWQGRPDEALRRYQQARPELHASGDLGSEALVLRCIGQVHLDNNRLDQADLQFSLALSAAQACGSRRNEAQVLFWQGMLRVRQHRFDDAVDLFSLVRELARTIGDKYGEAQALRGTALVYRDQGRIPGARMYLRIALALVQQPRPTFIEVQIREQIADLAAAHETATDASRSPKGAFSRGTHAV